MSSLVSSPIDDKTYSSESEYSNADLYASDLPLSFARRLITLDFRARSGSTMAPLDIVVEEAPNVDSANTESRVDRTSPEPPYTLPLREELPGVQSMPLVQQGGPTYKKV
jgi:hypothetical protein